MKKIFFIAFLGLSFVIVSSINTNTSWKHTFKKDLQAVYDTLTENHPGFYDDQNPAFKEWLTNGYQQALNKLEHISSFADYVYALKFFVQGFKDNHLSI